MQLILFIKCLILAFFSWGCHRPQAEQLAPPNQPQAINSLNTRTKTTHTVEKSSSAFKTLLKAGLNAQSITALIEACPSHVSLAQIQANSTFEITWVTDVAGEKRPAVINFSLEKNQSLRMKLNPDGKWEVKLIETPITVRNIGFTGTISSSLWDSAKTANMDPELIVELAQIFAWQIDFNKEVQPDDRWRLVVEQQFVNNEPIGWGNILAAEYENKDSSFTAIRFPEKTDEANYFDYEGKSLRKIFLKSPMRFSHITSTFKMKRFHPILKITRPHLGIDYGAPAGTPILAVGDGVVKFAGWSGDSGLMVKIRHNATYSTSYSHMSRLPKGIKAGEQIPQGSIVGYVGSTGLATGPHLHFSFFENDRFVDPHRIKFPSANPVPSKYFPSFMALRDRVIKDLPMYPTLKQPNETLQSRAISTGTKTIYR